MSMSLISRRSLLVLPLSLCFGRLVAPGYAHPQVVRGRYSADVGLLYDMVTLHLHGSIEETVDRSTGEYRVTAIGAGANIHNRYESEGVLRDGRWKPVRSQSWLISEADNRALMSPMI